MKLLTAKSRIAIGLACLLVSVLCTAMMIGIVPERRSAVLEGRAHVCEAIAVASSDYISRGEPRRLEFLLTSVVERNDDVLSAGVRRHSGQLITEVGPHVQLWKTESEDRSTDTHVQVPIRSGDERWGTVELRFRPLRRPGVAGWFENPWVRMIAFIAGACYVLFFFYLKKMLAHLDPSQTVPKRVRAALDSLAEGLLVIDKNQRIVLANQSLADWVGRSPDKLIGVHAGRLAWVANDNEEPLESYPWVEAIRQETPQAGVMLGLKQKGHPPRILIANASPVLGHDGKYRGVLVSFDDVTQLEETKRDLKEAKLAAEGANKAKSSFLARMSHEIRTPMNAILGYTDVLRRGFDDSMEDRQSYLDTIHGSGEHLLALINDILDLSKIESGRMELELARCSPFQIVFQVISVLRVKAEEKGISLDFECDGPLPETILTDSVRLRQTIMNLAGNAIKFTDRGGVRIVARLSPKGHATERVAAGRRSNTPLLCFDVIDTGIGISPEALEKIFDPFAQADNSITRQFGGTGLGLAISRQLAEALGGGIGVRSEPGKGSTFTVTIGTGPLDDVSLINAQTALENVARQSAQQKEVVQLPPSRILVADDGDSNRRLVKLVLERAGVEVFEAGNGREAVDQALAETFDVVLMDMQMPIMDGYEASRTLRSEGYQGPIIALTANAMQGDEEKCRAAGCSGFLTKPIKIDHLLAALTEVLGECPEDARRQPVESGATDPQHAVERDLDQLASLARQATTQDEAPVEDSLAADQGVDITPITCAYPLDDPDFLEIAQEFVGRFDEQLAAIHRAYAAGDCAELATLAHWIKGSGGTAGYDDFTQPAYELEMAAKARETDKLGPLIKQLAALYERIDLRIAGRTVDTASQQEVPVPPRAPAVGACASSASAAVGLGGTEPAASAIGGAHAGDPGRRSAPPPLISELCGLDSGFREIVARFIVRLEENLAAMDRALAARDVDDVAALAHWLKGAAGSAGFSDFTEPAATLEQLARQRDPARISAALDDVRRLAARVTLCDPATS